MQQTPYNRMRQLELRLAGIFSSRDTSSLPKSEQKIMLQLRRDTADAKLDMRDYQYAETGEEQQIHASAARKRLRRINKGILAASEFNIFSSIDVAEISAYIEQIITDISKE